MATKSILLASADPQALSDMTQAIGEDWEAIGVAADGDALARRFEREAAILNWSLTLIGRLWAPLPAIPSIRQRTDA